MGYEIKYFYKEELETKGQYSEEIKEKKVKVGDPWEEIPLENVAGKIMSQLARRNILIVDVEIFRLAKEKVSFRNTEDGIVIKNKKFKFDDGPTLVVEEENTNQLVVQQKNQPNRNLPAPPPESQVNLSRRVLRYETFDAQHPVVAAKARVGKFTLNKKYPIYEEITKGLPPLTTAFYKTVDDTGREVEINAECFTVITNPKLNFEGLVGGQDRDPGIPLSYGGTVDQMIDIRRK